MPSANVIISTRLCRVQGRLVAFAVGWSGCGPAIPPTVEML